MMTHAALTFAVSLPALLVAHHAGDHWVQTSHQADGKAHRARAGSYCCAKHVATYTITTAAAQGLVWVLFALPINPVAFLAGQLVSAVTHYWADRRFTLAWLARVLGKSDYYNNGGAYELDQSWHRAWLLIAALITALG